MRFLTIKGYYMSRLMVFKDKTFKVIEEYKNGLTQYVIHLYSNKLLVSIS